MLMPFGVYFSFGYIKLELIYVIYKLQKMLISENEKRFNFSRIAIIFASTSTAIPILYDIIIAGNRSHGEKS